MTDEPRGPGEIFDADWEAQARRMLESAGMDPDLGVRAARDALSVVAGELTEAEFHQRHHQTYLREFGVDQRPRRTAESALSSHEADNSHEAGSAFAAQISRRQVLRLAGVAGGAMFLSLLLRSAVWGGTPGPATGTALASAGNAEASEDRRVRWGMVIDLENCTGCLACVDGCHQENGLSDGEHWMYSLAFLDENRDSVNFLVRGCMHCSNAPCVKVCPVAARHVREADGIVLTDYDTCIGCRYCEVACPYGVNYFQWGDPAIYGGTFQGERRDVRGRSVIGSPPRGVMGKCNFCPQRIDDPGSRGTAACALACPHDAIFVGDLNDPQSAPRQHLEARRQENPNLSTFRLLDELGTEPNVIYIGQEPSERARPTDGPTRYEDWGLIEDRRAVLEGPEPWFLRMIGGA